MGSKNTQNIHEVGEFIQFNGTKRANIKNRKKNIKTNRQHFTWELVIHYIFYIINIFDIFKIFYLLNKKFKFL